MNENTIEKIIDYFRGNDEIFIACIEELDSYSGYLGDDRYYDMHFLDEFLSGKTATDILNMSFFGHDESYLTDKYGDRHYAPFNPNREYFTLNGYGNLVSCSIKNYFGCLDEWLIGEMSENRHEIPTIDTDDELRALFDEMERGENE